MPRQPRRKFGAMQKERIFLAALPDAATAARIHVVAEALKQQHGLTANLILPEHLHVTLFHLGDWPAFPHEIVTYAQRAALRVKAMPFTAVFGHAESFQNASGVYPFVLRARAAPWEPLRTGLRDALTAEGLGGATRGDFLPHITLAYDPARIKAQAITPVSWTIDAFTLIHSELGRTRHHHLGRWPLTG